MNALFFSHQRRPLTASAASVPAERGAPMSCAAWFVLLSRRESDRKREERVKSLSVERIQSSIALSKRKPKHSLFLFDPARSTLHEAGGGAQERSLRLSARRKLSPQKVRRKKKK